MDSQQEVKVTICPPSEDYRYGAPSFDRSQFAGRRSKAVSATSRGHDEWDTTGLSFGDFGQMHVLRRDKVRTRRLDTPEWAMDPVKMREVILNRLEARYYLQKSAGTPAERLARIDKEAKRRVPGLLASLKVLQAEYTDLAKDKQTDPDYLRRLGIEVQVIDTQIVLARRGTAAVMTAVVYNYYHLGWSNTEVANELGIKPPMVREWLYRLNHSQGISDRKPRTEWTPQLYKQFFAMKASGKTLVECAEALGMHVSTASRAWRKEFGMWVKPKLKQPKATVSMRTVDGAKKILYQLTDSKPVGRGTSKKIDWTPELLRKLKMMSETRSLRQCALQFGTTRCSVAYAITRACKKAGI